MHGRDVEWLQYPIEGGELLAQRFRVAVEVHEDEALPDVHGNFRQAALVLVEVCGLVHLGRGHQIAVGRIAPAMVGAVDHPGSLIELA
ncbi:hypothetical protein D3C75_1267750 [compost metagenome]